MSQHDQILQLLSDGLPHCMTELRDGLYCYDIRKRLSEIKRSGVNLISRPCGGSCGKRHTSNLHEWRLIKEIKQEVLF